MEAVTFGGWSKAENVKSIRQYCIYLDVEYDDGTFDWGRQANGNSEHTVATRPGLFL